MNLTTRYDERYNEIVAYISFLKAVDTAVKAGKPNIGGDDDLRITTEQQKILYAGLYLQLYNLVEATVTSCLESVSKLAMQSAEWLPIDLSNEMRKEWVRFVARTNVDLNPEKRLEGALELCDHLVDRLPVNAFEISKGGGGNWDDIHIERVAARLGCRIRLTRAIREAVKRPIRDDLGAMGLIVSLRNKLAHGSISFAECGQNDTPDELEDLAGGISNYLRAVIAAFVRYQDEYRYLRPESRPEGVTAAA